MPSTKCREGTKISDLDEIPIYLPLEAKLNASLFDKKNSMKERENDSLN